MGRERVRESDTQETNISGSIKIMLPSMTDHFNAVNSPVGKKLLEHHCCVTFRRTSLEVAVCNKKHTLKQRGVWCAKEPPLQQSS